MDGFSNRDVGAICLKGTTGKPRLGNPPHRVYETPMGMLNAIGLQNPGVDHVVRPDPADAGFHRDALHRQCLGLDDRGIRRGHGALRRLAHRRDRDQHLLPNVKEGGVQFGNSPEMSARVVEACRKVTTQAADHQAVAEPDRHPRERAPLHRGRHRWAGGDQHRHGHGHRLAHAASRCIGNRQGGLSGPAIKPIALLKVAQVSEVARPHRMPIIGQGGIVSANDAIEFLHRRRHAPSAWARRCSTTRTRAGASMTASRRTSRHTAWRSVGELIGSLDAPKKVVQACAC